MFSDGYKIAIRVLEDHIRKQDKVIEGLMRQLFKQNEKVNITVPEGPPASLRDDELDLPGLVELDRIYSQTPGTIINEDIQ